MKNLLFLIIFGGLLANSQEKKYNINNPIWEYKINDDGNTHATLPSSDMFIRKLSLNKEPIIGLLTVLKNKGKFKLIFLSNAVIEDGISGSLPIQLENDTIAKYYNYKGVPFDVDYSIYFLDESLVRKISKVDSILIEVSFIGQGSHVFQFKVKGLELSKIK